MTPQRRAWTERKWKLAKDGNELVLRMGDAIRSPYDHLSANAITLYDLYGSDSAHNRHCKANARLLVAARNAVGDDVDLDRLEAYGFGGIWEERNALYEALEEMVADCEEFAPRIATAKAKAALRKANPEGQ